MFASPISFEGNGSVEKVRLERTRVEKGRAVATGDFYTIPADIVISCIGYRTSPIPGVPFEERAGKFANDEGRILPGLYCVGWAKRGPSGTIGTNRPDGFSVVNLVREDIASGVLGDENKKGRKAFEGLVSKEV